MELDGLASLKSTQAYSPQKPLLGLTILLVEDSRYCSDAVRLMCLKSGARLRRADTVAAARRHLATYRPSVAVVDLGLPDGSGLEVIRDLAALQPSAPAILATSGDDGGSGPVEALAAGADAFMAKPLKSLKTFQSEILALFPDRRIRQVENVVHLSPAISPDPLARRDDFRHVLTLLEDKATAADPKITAYCAQFLQSVFAGDEAADMAADFPDYDPSRPEQWRCDTVAALKKRVIQSRPV